MKLQLILGFVILSMFMVPAFAEDSNIILMTDKSIYYINDWITISGSLETVAEYSQSVTLLVVNPEGSIVTIAQIIPDDMGNFSYTMEIGGTMNFSGTYEVRAQYGAEKHTITFEFFYEEEFPSLVQISTDKSLYNLNEIITVNVEMISFDDSKDGTITWKIYDDTNTIILTNTNNTTNDSTFTFTISTTELTTAGFYDIIVTLQEESSNRITFEYSDTPNMEPETLYSMITINSNSIQNHNSMLDDHYTMITDATNTILQQQQDIEDLKAQMQGMSDYQIIIDATAGREFPAKFSDNSLNRMNSEITKLQTNLDTSNTMISDYLIQLEQAQENNDKDLIERLEHSIGNQILTIITVEPILAVYTAIFELYPQDRSPLDLDYIKNK